MKKIVLLLLVLVVVFLFSSCPVLILESNTWNGTCELDDGSSMEIKDWNFSGSSYTEMDLYLGSGDVPYIHFSGDYKNANNIITFEMKAEYFVHPLYGEAEANGSTFKATFIGYGDLSIAAKTGNGVASFSFFDYVEKSGTFSEMDWEIYAESL